MKYVVEDFSKDDKVAYIPYHANGDVTHSDVENGIVSSINDTYVFVKYIRNGILQSTAQATKPDQLKKGHYK